VVDDPTERDGDNGLERYGGRPLDRVEPSRTVAADSIAMMRWPGGADLR
jgi:hypothetical protein